jgi:N-acetyl-anhydromuramyl-L-alanine amidase AmpD
MANFRYNVLELAENNYHQLLVSSGCIKETTDTFPDLPVWEIQVKSKYNLSGDLTRPNHKIFYDYHYLKTNTADTKIGICLHFTAGELQGGIECLTIPRESGNDLDEVSVPFVIGRNGYIYQLFHPDYYGYHLGSNFGWSRRKVKVNGTVKEIAAHPNIIGIEICNYGILTYWPSYEQLQGYCHISQKDAYIRYPAGYRGVEYFPTYTDKQYAAVKKLLTALCRKYKYNPATMTGIRPELLPESVRYEYFGDESTILTNAGWSPRRFLDWNGISSHVNWKGKNIYGNWEKWDIGPAFAWNRIVPDDTLVYPLQETIEQGLDSPVAYFYNSEKTPGAVAGSPDTAPSSAEEKKFKGGYYPTTALGMLHSGVHLACTPGAFSPIRCCAPGYIVAARFSDYDTVKPGGSTLAPEEFKAFIKNKDISFILVRHEINKLDTEYKPERTFVLYSLYMHLVAPPWSLIKGDTVEHGSGDFYASGNKYQDVKWLRKILKGRYAVYNLDVSTASVADFGQVYMAPTDVSISPTSGEISVYGDTGFETVSGASVYTRQPPETKKAYEALLKGKIITFTDSYLPVQGGEIIGYVQSTVSEDDGDYLHWEIFAPQGELEELLKIDEDLASLFTDKILTDEQDDNLLQDNDVSQLKNFLHTEEAEIKSRLDGVALPEDNPLKAQAGMVKFKDAMVLLFSSAIVSLAGKYYYPVTLKLDPAANIRLQTGGPAGNDKVSFLLQPATAGTMKYKAPDSGEIVNGNSFTYTELENGIQAYLPAGAELISAACTNAHIEFDTPADAEKSLFKKYVACKFRQVLLKHKTEWAEQGMTALLDKLRQRQISLSEQLADHVKTLCWWGKEGEYGEEPIYTGKSLFKTMLPGDNKIENLHPVTALWLLSILKNNLLIDFKDPVPATHENPAVHWGFYPVDNRTVIGGNVHLVVIAQELISGKPLQIKIRNRDTQEIYYAAAVGIDEFGFGCKTIPIQFWGNLIMTVNDATTPASQPGKHLLTISPPANYLENGYRLDEHPVAGLDLMENAATKAAYQEQDMLYGNPFYLEFSFDRAGNYPRDLDGFIFFRYQKRKKTGELTTEGWTVYDGCLPVTAGQLLETVPDAPGQVKYILAFFPAPLFHAIRKAAAPGLDEIVNMQFAFKAPNGGLWQFLQDAAYMENYIRLDSDRISDFRLHIDFTDMQWALLPDGFGEMRFYMGEESLVLELPLMGLTQTALPVIKMDGKELKPKTSTADIITVELALNDTIARKGKQLKFTAEVTKTDAFAGADSIEAATGTFDTTVRLDQTKFQWLLKSPAASNPLTLEFYGEQLGHCVPTDYILQLCRATKAEPGEADWVTLETILLDKEGNLKQEVKIDPQFFLPAGTAEKRSLQFRLRRNHDTKKNYIFGQEVAPVDCTVTIP